MKRYDVFMPDSPRVFDQIVSEIPLKPLVIFDLDSTLFDVSHRSQLILRMFSETVEFLERFPSEMTRLKSLRLTSKDWGIKEAFIREQFAAPQEFFHAVRDFWKKHFFSSEHLHADRPYEGAIEYVQALAAAGAHICYLTGRDDVNMRTGTLEGLRFWGLPLVDPVRDLIMKPAKGTIEDDAFKSQEIQRLSRVRTFASGSKSPRIWFFENEPLIIRTVQIECPDVQIVWIDTTHSRRAEPPEGLHVIRDVWRRAK